MRKQEACAPIEEGLDQADPERKRKTVAESKGTRPASADLDEALAPARALHRILVDPFWREANRQFFVQIYGRVAAFPETNREQEVFGNGIGGKTADLPQRGETNDGGGAAAEGQMPGVLGGHDDVEEEALLVRKDLGNGQVALDRIGIEEVLRRLHDAYGRVLEQAERARDEIGKGDEIRIEYGNEVRRRWQRSQMLDGVIDVAGLGMGIVGTGEVVTASLGAEIGEPVAPAVVEHPNPEIRIVHTHGADDGALQDGPVFVVGADQDVDERPRLQKPRHVGVDGGRSRGAARQHQPGDGSANPRQEFGTQEGGAKQPIGGAELGQRREPPKQIVPGHDQGDRDERRANERVFAVGPWEQRAEQASRHQRRRDRF
jgi:hypothetical protein